MHNSYVVNGLREKGAIFVEELEEIPSGSTVIFSAHGVSKAVRAEAEARKLKVFDATCPLVTKVHTEVAKMRHEGRDIIMIGHQGHPEVEGTMGQLENGMHLIQGAEDVDLLTFASPGMLAYVSQTTLSVDDSAEVINALKRRFPTIAEPKKADICYATTNRQAAVKAMLPFVDMVIVVGSKKQLKLQPTARSGGEGGGNGLHGRQCVANRPKLARRQTPYRRHGRCLCARNSGARCHCLSQGIGCQ